MNTLAKGWFAPALVAASTHVGLALVPVSVGAQQETSGPEPVRMSLLPRPEPEVVKPPEPPEPPPAVPQARPPLPRRQEPTPEPLAPESPTEVEEVAPVAESSDPTPLLEEPTPAVVEVTPAPPVVVEPKAPAAVDWSGYHRGLKSALTAHRRYPAMARRMGLEGVARVRIALTRSGQLAAPPSLARSSGHELLDREALRMVQSAAPFAALPPGVSRETVVFEVPVGFVLKH